MTTNLLRSVNLFANRNLFLTAALLVIACQLVAMAMVANGQMSRAGQRHSAVALEQTAIAQCFESSTPSAQSACMVRTRMAYSGEAALPAETVLPTSSFASFSPQFMSSAQAAERTPGIMAVSYPGQ